MHFIPGNRVSHSLHGLGTVARVTLVEMPSQGVESTVYIVQFDNDETVTFSLAAAAAELRELDDNDFHCHFCGESMQGNEIPAKSQHNYGATHFSRLLSLNDPNWGPVASQCPDCKVVWSAFTGERIKRMAMFWQPFDGHPRPISEIGAVHLWNIRRFRRRRNIFLQADELDRALTREIKRRWYAFPLILIWAAPSRRLYDRKRRKLAAEHLAQMLLYP